MKIKTKTKTKQKRISKLGPCVLSILGSLLSSPLYANTESQTCTWQNEYNNNNTETVTTQQISTGLDGTVTYETCDQAIARARRPVERAYATQKYNQRITGDTTRTCSPNYTPRPCSYTPPQTDPDNPPTPRALNIQQTGKDANGNPCYESCADAQRRAQEAFINNEWGGHKEDLEKAIADHDKGVDERAESAYNKAQKAANKKKIGSMIAIGGGAWAVKQAMSCCGAGCYGSCYYYGIAAALFATAINFYDASKASKDRAKQYSAGLIADERPTGGGNSTSTAGNSTGTSTGTSTGSDSNPTNDNLSGGPDPDLIAATPEPDTPTITFPDKTTVRPTPDAIETILAGGGGKWDPETGTITLPNGKSYSDDDLNKPEFKKWMNTPEVSNFKKDMAGLEKQIISAMGDEDLLMAGDGNGEGDGTGDTSKTFSGGGFSGYAGARRSKDSDYGSEGGGRGLSSNSANSNTKDGHSVAGMSVKIGKDRVGVRQDNIFEMMHRKYQQKRKKQHFIEHPQSG